MAQFDTVCARLYLLAQMYGPEDRGELTQCVVLMRQLGVERWGEIWLGPAPQHIQPEEQPAFDEVVKEQRRLYYENLLNRAVTDDMLKELPE